MHKNYLFETMTILSLDDKSFLTHRLPMALAAKRLCKNICVICRNTGQSETIKSLGFEVIDLSAEIQSVTDFSAANVVFRLARIYRDKKPNIVYHSSVQMSFIGAMANLLAGGVPNINAITGVGYLFSSTDLKAKILRCFLNPVLKFLWARDNTVLLFQNSDDRQLFYDKGLSNLHAPIIPGSGVDDNLFAPALRRRRSGVKAKTLVIGCASRLIKDKGLEELILAIKAIDQSYDIELHIAGEIYKQNPSSFSEDEVKKWAEIKSVKLLGNVTDMVGFWQGCDIAILPSHREGLPKALLEAAACGLPLLGSDVPGVREIVVHGSNGLLFTKGDSVDIASKIEKMIDDRAFRIAAGKASRCLIETGGFSNAVVEASFFDLFRSIKSRAAPASDK